MEVAFIGLLYADIGNRMAVDSLFQHCHIFLPLTFGLCPSRLDRTRTSSILFSLLRPFTPFLQVVDNRSLNPTRPLFRNTVFRSNGTELFQGRNNITDDGIRPTNTVITGKLDGILTSDSTELGPDVEAVILVRQEATIINDIGDIIGR